MLAFGPVPSRRLGRSLGVNNIPPKACTYSCVYCQLGRTRKTQAERLEFHGPEAILAAVREKLEGAARCGEPVDYMTFVADGEPTLDRHLGREIALLKPLGIRVAVITNASLIWRGDVQADLMDADWVSLKVDSVQERTWRRINRPHGHLSLPRILDGMLAFAKRFPGTLVTETMLVDRVNDSDEGIGAVADFLARLRPAISYLSIPTRPPAEERVHPPGEVAVNRAYQRMKATIDAVECLIGYEGNAFAFTGSAEDDLLSITAVHPMREDAVGEYLKKAGEDWGVVRRLIEESRLVETEFEGRKYYLRKLYPGGAGP
jgi:wyosine [tRNA(Phe)-imidazoG37] synthetase (radical SAM superfamily)